MLLHLLLQDVQVRGVALVVLLIKQLPELALLLQTLLLQLLLAGPRALLRFIASNRLPNANTRRLVQLPTSAGKLSNMRWCRSVC